MFDITAIGEILIDLTQTGVSEGGIPVYTSFPGGAPANVAVAASKLGAKTAFIGKVGDDAFGRLLVDTVKENNVCTDGMIVSKTANTTLAVVSVDGSGERNFAFYRRGFADTLLSEDEISDELLTNVAALKVAMKALAEKYGYHYIDVNEGLIDENGEQKQEFAIDGVHMLAAAYEIVFRNLRPYLGLSIGDVLGKLIGK